MKTRLKQRKELSKAMGALIGSIDKRIFREGGGDSAHPATGPRKRKTVRLLQTIIPPLGGSKITIYGRTNAESYNSIASKLDVYDATRLSILVEAVYKRGFAAGERSSRIS